MFQSHKYQAIKHTFHPSYIATQSIPSASIVIPSGNYVFRSQNSTFFKGLWQNRLLTVQNPFINKIYVATLVQD